MIIENAIKKRISETKGRDRLFIRNVLKEELQNFILNFIYTSKYKDLIFTGGTCLRKNYGLNRLSEDLDFDYINKLNINQFAKVIEKLLNKNTPDQDLSRMGKASQKIIAPYTRNTYIDKFL